MNKEISYCSLEELGIPRKDILRFYAERYLNYLKRLNEEFREFDPDGSKAVALAGKYAKKEKK